MARLENKTNKINVVISLKERTYDWVHQKCLELKPTFNESFTNYALIIHDKDTKKNIDTGEVEKKTLHVHFVGLSTTKRLLTFLNQFSTWFEISTFGIEIDKLQDLTGSIQYLIHRNDPDKFQYNVSDIITNFSEQELNSILDAEPNDTLTADKLIYYIGTSSNAYECMQRMGLGHYVHYLSVIKHLVDNGYVYGFLRSSQKEYLN